MKGTILDFSIQSNSGIILGEEGKRYNFKGADWKANSPPTHGASVDFLAEGDQATEIYLTADSTAASPKDEVVAGDSSTNFDTTPVATSQKSKVVAGLLAIFLGGLGIHKFYLGYRVPGVIYLTVNVVSGIVSYMYMAQTLNIVGIVISIISLIEGIIYLTKSKEKFQQTYVTGRRPMF